MSSSSSPASRLGSFLRLAMFGAGALFAGSCASMKPPTLLFDFYMEAPVGTGKSFTLPVTQQVKYCQGEAFLTEEHVTNVQGGTIDVAVGDHLMRTRCVYFTLDREGERQLELHTTSDNFGKKIYFFGSETAPVPPPVEPTASKDKDKTAAAAPADKGNVAAPPPVDDATAHRTVIGVRPIDQTISSGPLFVFLEIPGADKDPAKFDDYVAALKASVDQYQKWKKGN